MAWRFGALMMLAISAASCVVGCGEEAQKPRSEEELRKAVERTKAAQTAEGAAKKAAGAPK